MIAHLGIAEGNSYMNEREELDSLRSQLSTARGLARRTKDARVTHDDPWNSQSVFVELPRDLLADFDAFLKATEQEKSGE